MNNPHYLTVYISPLAENVTKKHTTTNKQTNKQTQHNEPN